MRFCLFVEIKKDFKLYLAFTLIAFLSVFGCGKNNESSENEKPQIFNQDGTVSAYYSPARLILSKPGSLTFNKITLDLSTLKAGTFVYIPLYEFKEAAKYIKLSLPTISAQGCGLSEIQLSPFFGMSRNVNPGYPDLWMNFNKEEEIAKANQFTVTIMLKLLSDCTRANFEFLAETR